MTEPTHTPGPWQYVDDGPTNYLINGPDTPVGEAGREANARLMAAAPDLLEALRAVVRDIAFESGNRPHNTALHAAEAAIEKAEAKT